MPRTTVMVMIDGLDPEYLEYCPAPKLRDMAKHGFMVEGRAMMPTVTNVNNVSLVTASYPEIHGITSNFWHDRESGEEVYMESGVFNQAETIFQRATSLGARSLLVTAKDKLRRLLGDGATLSVSSEQPPGWLVRGVGTPPSIYSLEVNGWVVDAARYILMREHYDLAYLATTDYAMHIYSPQQPESSRHLALLDEALGKLMDRLPEAQVLITADHGMSSKGRIIDPAAELARYGIRARAVPIIKDRYTVHHSNLGGCIYVYLESGELGWALEVLAALEGVDAALAREEAAARFHLMASRIGDIMVLGSADVVFGHPKEVEMPPGLRSHGSLYEDQVPIIGCGGSFQGFEFQETMDLGRYVFDHVLT